MNRLPQPVFFDDHTAVEALANNQLVGSFPQLLGHLAAIRAGYTQYVAAHGDAAAIATVPLPAQMARFLKGHYTSPPLNIAYIDEIRERSGASTCPMCGSTGCGTLDHVLPKASHPAFAIFGLNLVPACDCNLRRGTALLGPNPGERILHPYFDDILSQRLLAAHITDLGPVPSISLRLLLPPAHPQHAAVSFHVKRVVERTHIKGHLRRLWTKLIKRPGNLTTNLRVDPLTRADLAQILSDELDRLDEFHDSLNNWNSIFLTGILADYVLDWLFERFSRPGRTANDPLVS